MANSTLPSIQDRMRTIMGNKDNKTIVQNLQNSGAITSRTSQLSALASTPTSTGVGVDKTKRNPIQKNVWGRNDQGGLIWLGGGGENPLEALQKSAKVGGRTGGSLVNTTETGGYAGRIDRTDQYGNQMPLTSLGKVQYDGTVSGMDKLMKYPRSAGGYEGSFDEDDVRQAARDRNPFMAGLGNESFIRGLTDTHSGEQIGGTDHFRPSQNNAYDWANDSSRAYQAANARNTFLYDEFVKKLEQDGKSLPTFYLQTDVFGRPTGVTMDGGTGYALVDQELYNMNNALAVTQDPAEQAAIKERYEARISSAIAQELGTTSDLVMRADEQGRIKRAELDRTAANAIAKLGPNAGNINSMSDLRNAQFQRAQDQLDEKLQLIENQKNIQMQQLEAKRQQAIKENERKINEQLQSTLDSMEANGQFTTDAEGNLTGSSSVLEAQIRSNYANMLQDANMQANSYYDDRTASTNSTYMDKRLEALTAYDTAIESFYTTQAELLSESGEAADEKMSAVEEYYFKKLIDSAFAEDADPMAMDEYIKSLDTIMKWEPDQITQNAEVLENMYLTMNPDAEDIPEGYVEGIANAKRVADSFKNYIELLKNVPEEDKGKFDKYGKAQLLLMNSTEAGRKALSELKAKNTPSLASIINQLGESNAVEGKMPQVFLADDEFQLFTENFPAAQEQMNEAILGNSPAQDVFDFGSAEVNLDTANDFFDSYYVTPE